MSVSPSSSGTWLQPGSVSWVVPDAVPIVGRPDDPGWPISESRTRFTTTSRWRVGWLGELA
jgi:hypothetical protein